MDFRRGLCDNMTANFLQHERHRLPPAPHHLTMSLPNLRAARLNITFTKIPNLRHLTSYAARLPLPSQHIMSFSNKTGGAEHGLAANNRQRDGMRGLHGRGMMLVYGLVGCGRTWRSSDMSILPFAFLVR